jgi:hypothetical protein
VQFTRDAYGPVMVLCCWAKGEAEPLYLERVAEFIGGHFVLHSFLLPLYLSSMLALFRLLLPSFSGSVPPNPASIC